MSTKICPHCEETILQEAKTCPVCYESVHDDINKNNKEEELVVNKIIEMANEGREEGNKFEYVKRNEDEDEDEDEELLLPSEILRQIKENIAESYWILYRVENFKINLKAILAYQKISLLTQLEGTRLALLYVKWDSDEIDNEGEIEAYNEIDDYIEIMKDVHRKLRNFFKVDEDENENENEDSDE